jgi:hypothetical protein
MGYRDLAYAIVEQAVEDYKEARFVGEEAEEIEEFFDSNWCKLLLDDFQFTGHEIIQMLRSKPVTA